MKYVIFRNDGIGDLIVSTRSLRLIKISDSNAQILVICSDRNVQYADILKKGGEIDDYINSNNTNFLSLIVKIRNFEPDISFIFNNSSKNILSSFLTGIKRSYAIIPLNINKRGIKKYKTPLFFSNIFFTQFEIIDCRNSYKNSSNIHMSKHFINLVKFEFDTNENIDNYISPNYITNSLTPKIKDIFNSNKISLNSLIIFHLDEKWVDKDWSDKELYDFIIKISLIEEKINIIITEGMFKTSVNKAIHKHFNFTYFCESLFKLKKAKNFNNIYLAENADMQSFMGIIALSSLVIGCHGAITHIASIYKKKIIDIIPNEKVFFFNKWKPNTKVFKQIEFKDKIKIINETIRLLN